MKNDKKVSLKEKTEKTINSTKELFKKIVSKATKKPTRKQEKTQELEIASEKPKAPFKVLLCITLQSNSDKILHYLNTRNIDNTMVVKGYGTAKTSLLSMLGINETERSVIFALVNAQLDANIVTDLKNECDKNEIKNTVSCLISPKSANLELLKHLTEIGEIKND